MSYPPRALIRPFTPVGVSVGSGGGCQRAYCCLPGEGGDFRQGVRAPADASPERRKTDHALAWLGLRPVQRAVQLRLRSRHVLRRHADGLSERGLRGRP